MGYNVPVCLFPQAFIYLYESGKILPAPRCRKELSIHCVFNPVKVFSAKLQIGNHCGMDFFLVRIFFPHLKICFHLDFFQTIQSHHVKLSHRFIVLRRISCGNNDPALRDFLVPKGFSLQKLQHHRRKCF